MLAETATVVTVVTAVTGATVVTGAGEEEARGARAVTPTATEAVAVEILRVAEPRTG